MKDYDKTTPDAGMSDETTPDAGMSEEPRRIDPSVFDAMAQSLLEGDEKNSAVADDKADDKGAQEKTDGDSNEGSAKKYTVKIGGEVMEVDEDELIKGYQTAQYLTRTGQKIAEEKARLEAEKKALEDLKKELIEKNPLLNAGRDDDVGVGSYDENDDFYREYIAPHVKDLKSEIESLKNTVKELTEVTKPTVYQTVISQIDAEMKAEGFDDFKQKVPEIERTLRELPEEQFNRLNNREGFISIYKDLKLKELRELASGKKKQQVDERRKPAVSNIEGGSTPSGADDELGRYRQAFARAKESGDWSEVFKLKGVI